MDAYQRPRSRPRNGVSAGFGVARLAAGRQRWSPGSTIWARSQRTKNHNRGRTLGLSPADQLPTRL